MRSKALRAISILLAVVLCFSVLQIGVLAISEGDAGGDDFTDSGFSGNTPSYGDAFYNGSPSGVRIYLSTDNLVADNRYKDASGKTKDSTNGSYLIFGKQDVTKWLDSYKSLAIYEISDLGISGETSLVHYLQYESGKKLSARAVYKNTSLSFEAFYLNPRSSIRTPDRSMKTTDKNYPSGQAWNTKPGFYELFKGTSKESKNKGFTPWFNRQSVGAKFNFDSLATWAHDMFSDGNLKDLDKFLDNYRTILKSKGVSDALLAKIPADHTEFIEKRYCIVVEPVFISGIDGSSKDYFAWSAQDFLDMESKDEKYGNYFLKNSDMTFKTLATAMQKGFYINYTSKKYNQSSSPKGLVTAAPNGVYPNSAGGFAFYYSSDVVAQDVPVQVANTVVVDVGAPKYIKSGISADAVPPVGSVR